MPFKQLALKAFRKLPKIQKEKQNRRAQLMAEQSTR